MRQSRASRGIDPAGIFSTLARIVCAVALCVGALTLAGCTDGGAGCSAAFEASSSSATEAVGTSVPAEKLAGVPAERQAGGQDGLPATGNGPDATGSLDAGQPMAADETLLVRFLDVGQGDAALITCGGQSLLIDGGPSSASSMVYSVLDRLGVTHLDCIVATHPDADHCGGIAGALNYADCGRFYCSVTEHDTKTFKSIVKYLGATPITVPACGDAFALGGAEVRFVGPVSPTRDTNNGSLVCLLTYGDTRFLFTGDAEVESEQAMVSMGAELDADVLKVGHHGSDSSSCAAFIEAVSPDYAVISVGKNSYGHPVPEVVQRLQRSGATTLRTDELGTITIESDGTSLQVTSTKDLITR